MKKKNKYKIEIRQVDNFFKMIFQCFVRNLNFINIIKHEITTIKAFKKKRKKFKDEVRINIVNSFF